MPKATRGVKTIINSSCPGKAGTCRGIRCYKNTDGRQPWYNEAVRKRHIHQATFLQRLLLAMGVGDVGGEQPAVGAVERP